MEVALGGARTRGSRRRAVRRPCGRACGARRAWREQASGWRCGACGVASVSRPRGCAAARRPLIGVEQCARWRTCWKAHCERRPSCSPTAACASAEARGVRQDDTAAAKRDGNGGRGAKVAVVTIDPARRLASSLGLRELGNEPRRIDRGASSRPASRWKVSCGDDARRKRTFDELIDRLAPDARGATKCSRTASTTSCRARSPARRSSPRSPSLRAAPRPRLRPDRARHPPSRNAAGLLMRRAG